MAADDLAMQGARASAAMVFDLAHLSYSSLSTRKVNSLRAKFLRVNINIYLRFVPFLHIDMTQVLTILPHVVNIMAADVLAT